MHVHLHPPSNQTTRTENTWWRDLTRVNFKIVPTWPEKFWNDLNSLKSKLAVTLSSQLTDVSIVSIANTWHDASSMTKLVYFFLAWYEETCNFEFYRLSDPGINHDTYTLIPQTRYFAIRACIPVRLISQCVTSRFASDAELAGSPKEMHRSDHGLGRNQMSVAFTFENQWFYGMLSHL